MTMPTRDEALKALDKLSSEYDLAGGWSPDPMPLLAALRSYIESHTGEVVTYAVFDKTGKLRFVAPNEHDAHMALILSSADPDEFDVATMVKPLFASPVQPVLEWGELLGSDGLELVLSYNGRTVGEAHWYNGNKWAYTFMGGIRHSDLSKDEAVSKCEADARQWLSIGDK